MEAPDRHVRHRQPSQPRVRVQAAEHELSRPAYAALMTVYLGFAAYAAYEVALALSRTFA